MKLISWNVNGLRAVMGKDFENIFKTFDADVFCVQETKLQQGQIDFSPEGYSCFWNYAEKKGYSGTAVFSKKQPLSVSYGINIPEHDTEGRVITLEFPEFYLVCVYTPNAQDGLKRLDYRMQWEDDFRAYLLGLNEKKGVVVCGDLNVAATEIDIKNPKANVGNAGFTPQEREKFAVLKEKGFIDTFRLFYPELEGAYSWWSYRFKARERNAGWRIDYFLASANLKNNLVSAKIHSDIMGSDHCPVELEINF